MAAFLSSFDLMTTNDGVNLEWTLSADCDAASFRVRARRADQEWTVPVARAGARRFSATDRSPQLAAGGLIDYALRYNDPARGWRTLAEKSIMPSAAPRLTQLLAPYPNPFNPQTVIPYAVDRRQHLSLTVHDLSGRLVDRLVDRVVASGTGEVTWNGTDLRGRQLPSGVYFARLRGEDSVDQRKLVLMK